MRWQTINFSVLVEQVVPTRLRKVKTLSWLKALIKPLQNISDRTLYQMQHDSRVIYLEKVLNEYFAIADYDFLDHVATRKIYISDANAIERDYIFQPLEDEVMYLDVEDEEEYLDVSPEVYYHFIVNIPNTIVIDEPKLRAEIDFYRLAGKKYNFNFYEI